MPGKHYQFPVAEVGLGQMGVLRRGRREYDQHGAALQQAARLLRHHLDPSVKAKTGEPERKKRTTRPLRPGASSESLKAK